MTEPRRFRAMGCEVAVGGATAAEAAVVRRLLEDCDARFSRFRDDSELSRVNRATAELVAVSEPFAAALRAALDAAALTGGLVDPTLLRALEQAGYDADFAALTRDSATPIPSTPPVASALRDVELRGRLLVRPPGVRLDLNGVVKALAVDDALAVLAGPGWVSVGGDLASTRPLEVGLPGGGSVQLRSGALATSSPALRRWSRAGVTQHHLIDPRTGRPSDSRWTHVTVCATTCLGADVAAKAAFLLGDEAPAWLDAHELPGRLVDPGGEAITSRAWRAMTAQAPACT